MLRSRIGKSFAASLMMMLLCLFVCAACKSKKAVASMNATIQSSSAPIASGKVSHQYSASGCGTVIVCDSVSGKKRLIYIPITGLTTFDVDGLEISFNYRILKIHNPKGCVTGIPIQISNISKK
ncbi:MAG: hypothetical protein ABI199_03165 [Bacteroidia bacterium]